MQPPVTNFYNPKYPAYTILSSLEKKNYSRLKCNQMFKMQCGCDIEMFNHHYEISITKIINVIHCQLKYCNTNVCKFQIVVCRNTLIALSRQSLCRLLTSEVSMTALITMICILNPNERSPPPVLPFLPSVSKVLLQSKPVLGVQIQMNKSMQYNYTIAQKANIADRSL